MDRLEMLLPPSTRVGVADPRVAVEEMGPGNKMSPDMIGRESTEIKIISILSRLGSRLPECPTYCIRRGEVSRVGVAGGDEGVEGVRGGVERLTVAVEDDVVVTVV